jgi:hypothetical protein
MFVNFFLKFGSWRNPIEYNWNFLFMKNTMCTLSDAYFFVVGSIILAGIN